MSNVPMSEPGRPLQAGEVKAIGTVFRRVEQRGGWAVEWTTHPPALFLPLEAMTCDNKALERLIAL